MNIMLLITTNNAKNVASTIYQSLLDHSRKYHTICLSIIYDQLPTGWCLTIIRADPVQLPQRCAGGVHINITELITVLLYIVFYEAYSFSFLTT